MNERIAVITPWAPPACGIAAHGAHLIRAWGTHHEVHVIAPGNGAQTQETIADGTRVYVWRVLGAGKCAIEDAIGEINPTWTYGSFAISAYGGTTFAATQAFKTAAGGGPLVVGYHEPAREPRSLPLLGAALYRHAARHGKLLAFSDEAGEALASITGHSVAVVAHGCGTIDADGGHVAAAKRRWGRGYVLQFGFIHPDKGHLDLIKAAGVLAGRGIAPRIVIAGSVRERSGIFALNEKRDERYLRTLREAAARVREAGAQIEFVKYLPDEELHAAIAAAGAIVLPYRGGSQSGVASLVVASGRGAVISNTAGLIAQFGGAGLAVPAGDANAFAGGIERMLGAEGPVYDAAAVIRRSETSYAQVAAEIERIARS
jgi:glycosyltransferase involved in cell wall biosynthesis